MYFEHVEIKLLQKFSLFVLNRYLFSNMAGKQVYYTCGVYKQI